MLHATETHHTHHHYHNLRIMPSGICGILSFYIFILLQCCPAKYFNTYPQCGPYSSKSCTWRPSSYRPPLPFAIVIDNTPEARPQYGLSKADVVYESLTEGGVTRLLALFSSEKPLRIGPIRSARPYLVRQAQDWDAFLVHSGGSTRALDMLNTEIPHVYNLDEFSNGNAFVRTSQTPPHNLFTSYIALETLAENKAMPLTLTALPSWAYATTTPEGSTTTSFAIPYNLASMKVVYQYDEASQTYTR